MKALLKMILPFLFLLLVGVFSCREGAMPNKTSTPAGEEITSNTTPSEPPFEILGTIPEGEQIIYSYMPDVASRPIVRSMRPDGSEKVDIMSVRPGLGSDPRLSPDGKKIVFAVPDPIGADIRETPESTLSFGLGLHHLFLIEGSRGVQLTGLQERNIWDTPDAWSKDGRTIFFTHMANIHVDFVEQSILRDPYEVWAIGADGSNPHKISQGGLWDISPDGKTLSVYDDYGSTDLMNTDGSNRRRLREDTKACFFSPNGVHLACLDLVTQNIILIDLEGNLLKELTHNIIAPPGYSFSPDGKWLAYVEMRGNAMEIWKLPIDGSSPPVRLANEGFWNLYPQWTGKRGNRSAIPQ